MGGGKLIEHGMQLVFSTALITYGELWGIKATFCAIYLELANRLSLALKIMLGVLIAIVVGSFIVSFHALANQCRPVARIWFVLSALFSFFSFNFAFFFFRADVHVCVQEKRLRPRVLYLLHR